MLVRCFYIGTFAIRDTPTSPPSTIGIAIVSIAMFMAGTGGFSGALRLVERSSEVLPRIDAGDSRGIGTCGFWTERFLCSRRSVMRCMAVTPRGCY